MSASSSDFAASLRSARLRAALSQEELAERSGVSARAISDMERALRQRPRPETLRMLADALALAPDEQTAFFASAHQSLESPSTGPEPRSATVLPLSIQPIRLPLDSFIGRESDIAAIAELFLAEHARLVTLTGPGGVGKTRLALAVADAHRARWADGVAFVDLASVANTGAVVAQTARALGVPLGAQTNLDAAVVGAVRDRSLLLIFDNLEHLLDSATWIVTLLSDAPRLTVLVTSRVRLRSRGEHVYPVVPLAAPTLRDDASEDPAANLLHNPAIRLFRDRARQADYRFHVDDANAPAIAELCRRLDGIPLAIELAAARIGVLSPAAMLDRLELLDGGMREGPDRQQTLEQAIGWSYALLDPATQAVYRRLAVFSGGCTLDAAETVIGSDCGNVLAALTTLVENSLLLATPDRNQPRFTMLDTIYRDAALRLQHANETHEMQQRHIAWIAGLMERAGADLSACRDSQRWYALLDAETSNLRRAVETLLAGGNGAGVLRLFATSGIYLVDRLQPAEAMVWIDAALAASDPTSTPERVIACACLLIFAAFQNDSATAARADAWLSAWIPQIDDPQALGVAYFAKGVDQEMKNAAQSATDHAVSLSWFEQSQLPAWILMSTLETGNSTLLAGQLEECRVWLDRGIALAESLGSTAEMTYGLIYVGFAELAAGRHVAAATAFSEGLDLALGHRILRVALGCIGGLAAVAQASGESERAARLLGALEAARISSGTRLLPNQPLIDSASAQVLATLGPERDARLRSAGSMLTFDAARSLAIAFAQTAG